MHFRDIGKQELPNEEKRLDLLQQRVNRLERDNQRWGLIGGIVLAGIALIFVIVTMKRRPVDEVRAARFTLIDSTGQVKGYLEAGGKNGPEVVLLGAENKARLILGMNDNGLPLMTMRGPKGKDRIRLAVAGTTAAGLSFLSRSGRERSWVGVERSSAAGVSLFGTTGRPLAALSVRGRGTSGLSLFDSDGRESAGLGVSSKGYVVRVSGEKAAAQLSITSKGLPRLLLEDQDKGTRGTLQPTVESRMALTLQDRDGHAAVLGPDRMLLGKDQVVQWSAP